MLSRLEKLLLQIHQKHWRLLFWIFWTACTILLLLPGKYVPEFNIWDKLEHASIFVPMVLLGMLGYAPAWRLQPLALALQAYGMLVECLQYFIPGRSFSVLDMLADAFGIGVAVVIVLLWMKISPTKTVSHT